MIGVVIATHADIAEAMLATARRVIQYDGKAAAVEILETDTTASYEQRLRRAVTEVEQPQGVLVLTDMFGGTPSNVSMTLHESNRIEVLTGANLPMVIKALQLSGGEEPLTQVAQEVKDAGVRAIAVASDVLAGDKA
ncbi:MAG: PTS sugar transporter subunit IIA [Myxococcota bacterium]